MPQTFLKPEQIRDNRFLIDGDEAHHLIHVLRKQTGDAVLLFDGQGHRYEGRLTAVDPKTPKAEGQILKSEEMPPRSPELRLFQGLIKGAKFDFVVEKATELGVDEIFPFAAERGIIKIEGKSSDAKHERWKRLAEAAAKQCGRPTVPRIHENQTLIALEPELKDSFSFVLWEEEKQMSLKRLLSSSDAKAARRVNFFIGPEGGLTSAEIEWLSRRGVQAVSVGEKILRSETAGLVVLSILNHEFGFFD